jgi:hypothetical protein
MTRKAEHGHPSRKNNLHRGETLQIALGSCCHLGDRLITQNLFLQVDFRETHRKRPIVSPWRLPMKRIPLAVFALLLTPPLFADMGTHLIPAGSLVSCTTGDGRISSRTTAVGDPILCKVEHRRGDFMLPYGSYLGGEFAEFKDPGHFVGKGWMELSFDKLYVGDTVVPINAKVVDVPGYKIDSQGRILGKGHVARDITMWCIPVLWPVDLIMLPLRGPRPALKSETTMTLRVMDDIQVPAAPEPQRDPYGLYQRQPNAYSDQPPPPTQAPEAAPQESYAPPQAAPYDQPPPPPAYAYAPAPVVPYVAPVVPPIAVAPPIYAYGGFYVGPRPAAVPYYAPRAYPGGPGGPVRAYGYAPRAVAPGAGVRGYAYGYAGRAYAGGGYTSRGPAMAARGGMSYGGGRGR